MAGFQTLLDSAGTTGKTLFVWGFLVGVVGRATEPFIRKLEYEVNQANPNVVLSPAELADAVVRQVIKQADAEHEASSAGIDPERFATLTHLAGNPPGLETILEWYRRGIIPFGEAGPTKPTVANAIATSRIYTYWTDAIKRALVVPIAAAELVDARVENQIELGTRENVNAAAGGEQVSGLSPGATTFYEGMWANGITPDQADVLFNTRGNPPSPTELFELYRRGVIPKTGTGPEALSVEQGIFEGATKDKWWPTIGELARVIPSLFYIKDALTAGTMPVDLATRLMKEAGYTTAVIAAVVGSAGAAAVATYKKLTESIIADLYTAQAIDRPTAATLLGKIGYGTDAAAFVLEYIDLKRIDAAVKSAIGKIGTQFINHKITATQVRTALARLDVPTAQVATLIATWTLEAASIVKLPTAAEYVDLVKYNIKTVTYGLAGLVSLGYTPHDAWVVMSAGLHAAAGTEPQHQPNPLYGITTPGGTATP